MIPTRFSLPSDIPSKLEKVERREPTAAEVAADVQWIELRSFEADWSAFGPGWNLFGALTGSEEA